MTTEYVQRLHFFLAGVIRFGLMLSTVVGLLLFARCLDSSLLSGVFGYDVIPTTAAEIKAHQSSVVLTLVFVVTFAYSLFGAVITGASEKTRQSVCFSCLFSTSLALSIVGFGLSWITPLTLAVWWMIATVFILIGTSYFAQKNPKWQQTSSNELQKTGKTF